MLHRAALSGEAASVHILLQSRLQQTATGVCAGEGKGLQTKEGECVGVSGTDSRRHLSLSSSCPSTSLYLLPKGSRLHGGNHQLCSTLLQFGCRADLCTSSRNTKDEEGMHLGSLCHLCKVPQQAKAGDIGAACGAMLGKASRSGSIALLHAGAGAHDPAPLRLAPHGSCHQQARPQRLGEHQGLPLLQAPLPQQLLRLSMPCDTQPCTACQRIALESGLTILISPSLPHYGRAFISLVVAQTMPSASDRHCTSEYRLLLEEAFC